LLRTRDLIPLEFSPDGTRLALGTAEGDVFQWDLHDLRAALAQRQLDWPQPPLAPRRPSPPLSGVVTLGGLAGMQKTTWVLQTAVARETLLIAGVPLNPPAYFRRALGWALLEQWPRAEADCQRFLDLCPDDLPGLYLSGQILRRLGREREAMRQFARAVQREPRAAPTSLELERSLPHSPQAEALNGQAWEAVRSPDGSQPLGLALLAAQQAVLLAPDVAYVHNTLGVAYYRLGRWHEANTAFRQSMRLNQRGPTDAYDLYFLAMCNARLGEHGPAQEAFERAETWLTSQNKLSAQDRTELTEIRKEAGGVLHRAASSW
jgi:tetratricopeptide (TPR) repeat protein